MIKGAGVLFLGLNRGCEVMKGRKGGWVRV